MANIPFKSITFPGLPNKYTVPEISSDLMTAGKAADAKATGDALSALEDSMNDEVSAINESLVKVGLTSETSANLLNPDELEVGRITSNSPVPLHTGSYDTDYKTTGFIPVEEGEKYSFYAVVGSNIINCAVPNIWSYDGSKTALSYIGSIAYNADGTSYITIPQGAKYIRASISTIIFTNYGTVQCSKTTGVRPESIVPYYVEMYFDGYVQNAELENVNRNVGDIQTIINDNFSDIFREITTGTKTNHKYINANGNIEDIETDYSINTIPASVGDKFKITAKAHKNRYYYAFYDTNDNFIGGLKSTESGTTNIVDYLVVAPVGTAKLVAVGAIPTTAVIKGVVGQTVIATIPWTGKKWVCVGDSLTQINAATTKHYYDYISDASGITPYNMGVGGTGYCRGYNNNNAFYQRISSCPTDADIVTIFGSGNDCNIEAMSMFDNMTWAQALGTYTDATTDTLCGCVNATLDAYFAFMPTIPIGIIAPTPWQSYPTTRLLNNRFDDYAKALKQICEYRGVPFLDLYHHSNLRPENEANRNACFYNSSSLDGNGDGVHPNELGHEIISSKIYEFIKTLLVK